MSSLFGLANRVIGLKHSSDLDREEDIAGSASSAPDNVLSEQPILVVTPNVDIDQGEPNDNSEDPVDVCSSVDIVSNDDCGDVNIDGGDVINADNNDANVYVFESAEFGKSHGVIATDHRKGSKCPFSGHEKPLPAQH